MFMIHKLSLSRKSFMMHMIHPNCIKKEELEDAPVLLKKKMVVVHSFWYQTKLNTTIDIIMQQLLAS